MKYAIYAGIGLFVIYNVLTMGLGMDLIGLESVSILDGFSLKDTLSSLI